MQHDYVGPFFSKSIIENQYIDRSISIFENKKKVSWGYLLFAIPIYLMIHHSSKAVQWFLQTSDRGFFAHRQTNKLTHKVTFFYPSAFCHFSFRLRNSLRSLPQLHWGQEWIERVYYRCRQFMNTTATSKTPPHSTYIPTYSRTEPTRTT